MMNLLISLIAGFFASIGVGGGAVLVIYLSLFLNMEQLQSQAINLLFFIPCAFIGLFFHIKNKLIDFKRIVPLILFGLIGVLFGYYLSGLINAEYLRKLFGAFLFVLASNQLFGALRKKEQNKVHSPQ